MTDATPDTPPAPNAAAATAPTSTGAPATARRAETTTRTRRARRRTFYSIGEVCEMFDLKPHVLRYWETQFEQLHPSKNRAGVRVYQADEVETIALIRRLVHEEGYTIQGARRRIDELRDEGGAAELSSRSLDRAYLRSLQRELESLLDLLDPAPAGGAPRDA
jgi:DNA-binding transcriptional MerR regulator